MTRSPIIPLFAPRALPVASAGATLTRGLLPLDPLAALRAPDAIAYGMAAMDNRGRIADRAVLVALGWDPGTRVRFAVDARQPDDADSTVPVLAVVPAPWRCSHSAGRPRRCRGPSTEPYHATGVDDFVDARAAVLGGDLGHPRLVATRVSPARRRAAAR